MRKLILGILVLCSTLMAEYSNNYVARVLSITGTNDANAELVEDFLTNYSTSIHNLPSPISYTGYLSSQQVFSAQTPQVHSPYTLDNGTQEFIYVDVYVFNNSSEYIQVFEASMYELNNGNNERVLDNGLTVSEFRVSTLTLDNGDRIIRYRVPDLSNDTKRVRITTCSKWQKATEEWCTHTLAFITGSAQ